MSNKKTNKEDKVNKDSFFYKYKNDSKYNAKAQLIFYVVFIIFVVIYLNFSRVGKNYDYNNITNKNYNNKTEETNLFDVISDNYNYKVNVSGVLKNNNINYIYSGKRSGENTTIDRNVNNKLDYFYKISDEYYVKNDDEYKFIDSSLVYDTISYKYLEFDSIMKLLKKASLDHVENTSSGEYNYKYNLLVRDVVKSYNGDDVVSINVHVTDYNLSIDIDYTNLFKIIYNDFSSCKINYLYSDIGKVDKFVIIDNKDIG